MIYDEIPSLDLQDFLGGDEHLKSKFVQDLGQAYEHIGFVAVKNHGFTEEKRQRLYDVIREFFSLNDEIKQHYEKPELFGQRGYIGKGKEHAKGRSTGDLKEFFHVGQELPAGDPLESEYPGNIWPEEVDGFRESTLEAYSILENTGIVMLRAIALFLNLEEHYFDDKVRKGNSILRPIHYFPITDVEDIPDDAVRAAEHGDINLITLLMGASADGLQVLRRDGQWIPITALPDQLVINVGDMLSRLTNNKLKSTIHRVVNPPKDLLQTSRFSIPFFMHPKSEMDLSCLESCVDEAHPKLYGDITAGEFLDERLKEIGLKK